MWQRKSLAFRAGRKQHCRRRRRLTKTDGRDVVLDELHRVINGEQRRDVTAGAVDVNVDVLVWVFAFKVNQLCANQVGDRVVDWSTENDYVLFEQTAVKVIDTFATAGLLGDIWNVVVANKIHEKSSWLAV